MISTVEKESSDLYLESQLPPCHSLNELWHRDTDAFTPRYWFNRGSEARFFQDAGSEYNW